MSPPLPCPKRARVATAPYGAGAPWASLPEDLVQLIGWRVLSGDLLDYVRFRAVCAHWSRSAARPGGRGLLDPRFHPRRWMMLPEGHGLYPGHPALGGHVRFLNLSTGALARLHLPLFHDHVILGCTDGLLLLLRHCDPGDTAVRLLHPFTGDVAELPPLSSLLPQMERYGDMTEYSKLSRLRGFLSGVGAAVTVGPAAAGAITVVLALESKHLVAHATTGDQRWTLSASRLPRVLGRTVSFHGNLYAVTPKFRQTNSVHIWQIDPPELDAAEGRTLLPPRIIAHCPLAAIPDAVHLVECGSELMVVGFNDSKRTDLAVYRVADLISGRVVPITNIGEHALFLGTRPLYASQNKGLPSVVANSITCRYRVTKNDALRGGRPFRITEQYHIGTGTWSPATDEGISCWNEPPASPYMLIHHIFTCCQHSYWNKGLIFHDKIKLDWSVKPNLWMYGLMD
ncbi:hypothetical protein SETIT_9G501900v2 [Setaria italica]|uniref:KIB1-4 beta-propeller domain-containing protein n=1 Tax=Setaria italica TaxID=4555 RepID=K4A9S7_SETIT|nr:uncharacterized protein LOC101782554 [Setaria italica]RCV46056.1 hypothetical protein SETIT_9G501900v2 [Setaria italica]